jgi:hypothetical protein
MEVIHPAALAAATRGPASAGRWATSRSLRSVLVHAARYNSSGVRHLPRLAYQARARAYSLGLFSCLLQSPADASSVSYTCSASGIHTTWRPGPRRMVCPLGPFSYLADLHGQHLSPLGRRLRLLDQHIGQRCQVLGETALEGRNRPRRRTLATLAAGGVSASPW